MFIYIYPIHSLNVNFLDSRFAALFAIIKTLFWSGMQQATGKRHICFMSPKCQWSMAFLRELERTPYLAEFQIIDVAKLTPQQRKDFRLTKVPTLVISDPSDPEPMKTDGEVMNWLSLRKLRDSSGIPRAPPAPGISAPSAVQQSVPSEPEPFVFSEMGMRGQDPYSFIDQDTMTQGNGGLRIQHSYEFLNGPMQAFGGAGSGQPVGGGGGGGPGNGANFGQKKSKKEEMFDAQMEAYAREREMGMPQTRPRQ